jgi:hypothetical protein
VGRKLENNRTQRERYEGRIEQRGLEREMRLVTVQPLKTPFIGISELIEEQCFLP